MQGKKTNFNETTPLHIAQRTAILFFWQYTFYIIFTAFSALDFWFDLDVRPIFALILVFNLSVHKPSHFPIVDIIILGLLNDITLTMNLGYYVSLFAIMRILIDAARPYAFTHAFFTGIGGFSLMCFFAFIMEGLFSLIFQKSASPATLSNSYMLLILTFPIFNFLLAPFLAKEYPNEPNRFIH